MEGGGLGDSGTYEEVLHLCHIPKVMGGQPQHLVAHVHKKAGAGRHCLCFQTRLRMRVQRSTAKTRWDMMSLTFQYCSLASNGWQTERVIGNKEGVSR